jgi:hypothetical protein
MAGSRPSFPNRPGICQRKRRYATSKEAEAVAARADVTLRAYKCAPCSQYHLTSGTKGMRTPAHELEVVRRMAALQTGTD